MSTTGGGSAQPPKWTARLAVWCTTLPAGARIIGGVTQGLMSAAAAIIAYLPTQPLGLREGFWASITSIAVVQTEASAVRSSARDQFAGAAIGGTIGAVVGSLTGQHLYAYALAIVLAMLLCWLCKIASAARLAGSTVTILLLVPHQGTVGWMMLSRLAEVAWGVTVAIAVVWVVNRVKAFEHIPTGGSH